MKQSEFLSLNLRDASRSLVVALLTALIYWAQDVLIPGMNIDPIVKTLLSAGCAYLIKNLFTPKDKIGGGGIQNPPKP